MKAAQKTLTEIERGTTALRAEQRTVAKVEQRTVSKWERRAVPKET